MKKNFDLKIALVFLISTLIFVSCQNDKDLYQKETANNEKQVQPQIIKEFALKESWFPKIHTKSASVTGDIYANFGVGYDILKSTEMLSIFNPNVSLSPIVSTTLNEQTDMVYTSTSDYSEIDNKVTSALATSLNVSTAWVKSNSNLSISKSSSITNTSNSVYVNVLYIKRYGRGTLQYTTPTINNYLTYRTNINDYNIGGKDGINLSNTEFRGTYGDRFKSALTFGVMLVGTVQITNVDFAGSTKDDVSAQASAAVQHMLTAKVSWNSEQSSNAHFNKSGILVSVSAIPRTSAFVTNISDLNNQLSYMDQCYANNDLGIIANELTKYSYLYPTYSFINIDQWYYQSQSYPIYTYYRSGCEPYIEVYPLYSNHQEIKIGNWLKTNYDPTIMKPLYAKGWNNPGLNYLTDNANAPAQLSDIVGYVFKQKIYDSLVPLYFFRYENVTAYMCGVYNTTGTPPSGNFSGGILLGYIFPN